jgi:glycosyltransferase involved in cell wall biosynthesis
VFLDEGGDLAEEFVALGNVLVAGDDLPYAVGRRWTHRHHVRRQFDRLRSRIEALGPADVVHVHCAGSMRIVPALPAVPVLCHLHELEVGLDLHLGPIATKHLASADRYVAVSDGVRAAALRTAPISPDRIERQWGFVDADRLPSPIDRRDLDLDPTSFVVVSSGVRHWRKAPELFVRVALAARARAPHVRWRFVWVGGADTGGLEALVERAGLDDLVTFLPHQPDPFRWLDACDVFLLPAREDAFPLVCVEVAAIGRPIVTFDNGGAADLVRHGECGVVVPFPEVDAAAKALADLAEDSGRRLALGERARDFAHRNLLLAHAGPRLLTTIEQTGGLGP